MHIYHIYLYNRCYFITCIVFSSLNFNAEKLAKVENYPLTLPSIVLCNFSVCSFFPGDTLSTNTTGKTNKVDTFLPSIIQDVHACPLLENTIREVIHKHKQNTNDVTHLSTSVVSNSSVTQDSIISNSELSTCTEESYVYNRNMNEAEEFLNNITPVKEQAGSENELDSLSFTEECHFESQDELKRRKNKNSIGSICNYSQLFGTREQLLNLVTHEGEYFE